MVEGTPSGDQGQNVCRAWFVGFNSEDWYNIFLEENRVSVGWNSIKTDISELETHSEIVAATGASYFVHPRNPAVQLRKFAHEAAIGDIVVVKNGQRFQTDEGWGGKGSIRAIGVLNGEYEFTEGYTGQDGSRDRVVENDHARSVRWFINFDEKIGGAFKPKVQINRWTFDQLEEYYELKRQIVDDRGLSEAFQEVEEYASSLEEEMVSDWPTVWIEKSYHDRSDRDVDGWGLGDALWCPQTRTNGGASTHYDMVTNVEKGDVILHLDQGDRAFTGTSTVADEYQETTCLGDTEWDRKGVSEMGLEEGERPAYRVPLENYQMLSSPLDVNDVLSEERADLLDKIRNDYTVVYNKNQNLNQGAYLTETNDRFVELICEAYERDHNEKMPHLEHVDPSDPSVNPTETEESWSFSNPDHPAIQQLRDEDAETYSLTAPVDYWLTALQYRSCGFEEDHAQIVGEIQKGDVFILHAGGTPMHSKLSTADGFVFGIAIAGKSFDHDGEWWYDDIQDERTYPHRTAFDRLFLTPGAANLTNIPDPTAASTELSKAVDQLQSQSVSISDINDRCQDAVSTSFPSRQPINLLDDNSTYGRGKAVADLLADEVIEVSPIATSVDFQGEITPEAFNGLVFPEQFGITPPAKLAKQITAAVRTGDHIIFTGPPGTGKTEVAQQVAECLAEEHPYLYSGFQVTTATADWSTFDTVGGYMPTENGGGEEEAEADLAFTPGIVLNRLKDSQSEVQTNEPIIIDELNRADIDKGFGQLFTLLSGQSVQLPFTRDGQEIELVTPDHLKGMPESNQYVVPDSWPIFATMNTYDKTSLYEMSYAFMRRFAFIRIPAPDLPEGDDEAALKDLDAGMQQYVTAWGDLDPSREELRAIGLVWKHTNQAVDERAIGPAIVKDMLGYVTNYRTPGRDDLAESVTEAVISYIFPQLEGVPERTQIVDHITDVETVDREAISAAARDMLQVTLESET